ncbi:Cytochrome oxidase Cu insertion factor, SCO1/SenC/PrrC family [Sulfobacillus thermosulfidooxidans DSM 9293]|uniref:Cytochrome oxidase Cu insertion factor, SCO1/SenC/PrrC family n=1 Tax=Sulfobacillus thermosulfidooxidans (strain DSM 9293 / VKM B-1269 / AT-1) TaxID=929705 RepID=A0A1W1WHL4_SULTA|nr:redoxin domain-containing protein [Sulfobacillus thermosulfidooxidans]SMC05672.1 Cytochrome oxidase Cu insertion factor, SCO1/SenC/PrrC family [Sulfobacillus thermosulfidooxidans DSM 9293]
MKKSQRKWIVFGLLPVAAFAGWGLSRVYQNAPSTQLTAAATEALAADGMTYVNKPAPNFQLLNAQGQPVSLTQYRGKVVVLTFFDPVCWWDCPLEAQELVDMNHVLGPLASHVQIIAVDANPEFHSLKDIQAFDTEHGLNSVPNFTYLTSPSVSTLSRVWHNYYEYVHVPKYGMVQHADVFWLISPKGREVWLSNPEAQTKYIGGTAQLLATYVAKILHQPLPDVSNPSNNLGQGVWQSIGPSYALVGNGLSTWSISPYQGYRTVERSLSGGNTWQIVTPEAMTQRGGIEVEPTGANSAWALVGAYGYQVDPVLRTTTNSGQTWSAPLVIPGPLPPRALHPLVASSQETAWVISDHELLRTTTGGQTWTTLAHNVPWMPEASLSQQPQQGLWMGGQIHSGSKAYLWSWTGKTFTQVPLPVPTSWAHQSLLVMAPTWQSASQGEVAVVWTHHGQEWLIWDRTSNDGKTWQRATVPLQIQGNPYAAVSVNGDVGYALTASGHINAWTWSQNTWHEEIMHLPAGTPVALDVANNGHVMVMTRQDQMTILWDSQNNGTTWTPHHLP